MFDLKSLKTVEEVRTLGRAIEHLAMATERLGLALEKMDDKLDGTLVIKVVGDIAHIYFQSKDA